MKRSALVMHCLTLILTIGLFSSCNDEIEVIGVEVSGSSFDGIYLLDKTYTKGTKYVNQSDGTERIKTVFWEDKNQWVLMKNNVVYYKIEQDGPYPPDSQWECGIGADKDKFKCELIID